MKDLKYLKILDSVLRLEVSKGHLRWKIADLSRLSGVQRTLIYYYFGKSKPLILETAMKTIGDEFFGLSRERMQLWQEGKIKESILATRQLIANAPYIKEFFFHWRHRDSDVCDHLKTLERRYLQKLQQKFPKLTKTEAEAVFAVFFGLVVAPELSSEALERVLQNIRLPI